MGRKKEDMNMDRQIQDEMLNNVVGGTGKVEATQYEGLTIGQRIRLWNGAGSPNLDENFSWGVIIGFKAPFVQFDLENKDALGESENPAWIHIQLVRESLAMMR